MLAQNHSMVKVIQNPGVKTAQNFHKKTKSTYVAAVAQTANNHCLGAHHTPVGIFNTQSEKPTASFYNKRSTSTQREKVQPSSSPEFINARSMVNLESYGGERIPEAEKYPTASVHAQNQLRSQSLTHRQANNSSSLRAHQKQPVESLGSSPNVYMTYESHLTRKQSESGVIDEEGRREISSYKGSLNQQHFASVNVISSNTEECDKTVATQNMVKTNPISKQPSNSSKGTKVNGGVV